MNIETKTTIAGLRLINAVVAVALLGGVVLEWNDSVFLGMVVKPLVLVGLVAAAAWTDEWLSDRKARQPAHRWSLAARGNDRRRHARGQDRDRRRASSPAGFGGRSENSTG